MTSPIFVIVLIFISFTLVLSINRTAILEHSFNYLSKYNDMNLESIMTICDYAEDCEENSVFHDAIWKLPFITNNTIPYTSLIYDINTTDHLLKLLSQFTPTLIVLLDFTTSRNIQELFN